MPIYEYRCAACGHQEDHLQKLSEAPLTKCPACGKKKYAEAADGGRFPAEGLGLVRDRLQGRQETGSGKAGGEGGSEGGSQDRNEDGTKAETKTETKTEAKTE